MDIDVDVESSKRQKIIQLIKEKYGKDKVLNVATFGTQKTMRVVDDSCRAFGFSPDEASNFKNLIPRYGTDIPSIEELFETDNDFSNKVREYNGLEETMKKASGLISSRGQHASGVIIFPDNFIKYNAMMKAPDGTPTTQYDLHQSEKLGAIKFDILSIKLDYIHEVMNILLEQGKIQWQGSLKATYDKYFSINNIDLNNKDIYDELKSGRVTAMFQFDKESGNKALNKINCKNFDELCAANSLMRLHTDGEEQLIDRYIRFKNNPQEQEDYMDKYNLTMEEKKIIHDNLDERFGVCDTQEYIMQLLMDKRITDYNILEANAFRKVIAGKKKDKLQEQKDKFYNKMKLLGRSNNFANYIWEELFMPTTG